MPDLQTFGAVPPSPDTHSCYQGWEMTLQEEKLTTSILEGDVNSDIVGTSIYGFISVKTHFLRGETELFPKERGQVVGRATLGM